MKKGTKAPSTAAGARGKPQGFLDEDGHLWKAGFRLCMLRVLLLTTGIRSRSRGGVRVNGPGTAAFKAVESLATVLTTQAKSLSPSFSLFPPSPRFPSASPLLPLPLSLCLCHLYLFVSFDTPGFVYQI